MGFALKVAVTTQLPPADANWNVDLGDDPKNALIYGNLAYDLVAAAMARLGVEYSKFVLDGDEGQFRSSMDEVQTALKAGVV
jgi:hypothetical protein